MMMMDEQISSLAQYYANDGKHNLQEPTNGVRASQDHYFQRFWRDTTSGTDNSQSVWSECTCNASGWYPNDAPWDGSILTNDTHAVFITDIPDVNSKQVHL